MVNENNSNKVKSFQITKENHFFDRKSARIRPDDIVCHLVVFDNASGGTMVIDIENDGRITGFQVNRALQLEEFKTGAIRCLTETPITVHTFEIPVINEKGEKDSVLVLELSASYNKVIQ